MPNANDIQKPEPTPGPTKGYGKRPLWQWILMYVIVGIVVYGAIYLLFFQGSSTGGGY